VSIQQLRKQLRDLQKRWRMENWRIKLTLAEYLEEDGKLHYGTLRWNLQEHDAEILLATVPAPPDTLPPLEETLAHEFGHLVLVELQQTFKDTIHRSSTDWQVCFNDRWSLAAEQFCNAFAFAEAVTVKGNAK
jgi:hypothetical protein